MFTGVSLTFLETFTTELPRGHAEDHTCNSMGRVKASQVRSGSDFEQY